MIWARSGRLVPSGRVAVWACWARRALALGVSGRIGARYINNNILQLNTIICIISGAALSGTDGGRAGRFWACWRGFMRAARGVLALGVVGAGAVPILPAAAASGRAVWASCRARLGVAGAAAYGFTLYGKISFSVNYVLDM